MKSVTTVRPCLECHAETYHIQAEPAQSSDTERFLWPLTWLLDNLLNPPRCPDCREWEDSEQLW